MKLSFFSQFFSRRVTVFHHQTAILFRDGAVADVLGAGTYRMNRRHESVMVFSRAPLWRLTGSHDYLTADGGAIRAAFSYEAGFADLLLFYNSGGRGQMESGLSGGFLDYEFTTTTPFDRIATFVEMEVGTRLASMPLQEAVLARDEIASLLREVVESRANEVGLELKSADVVCFEPTGTAKSGLTDLLRADLEGQAAMKRARNEASVMRSLLNTSRLVRDHPGLLELRILTSGQKPRVAFTVSSPYAGPVIEQESRWGEAAEGVPPPDPVE
jgi:hypothetical protein